MSVDILLKRGTKSQNDQYTGKSGELIFDNESKQLRIHDGIKKGGFVVGFNNASIQAKNIKINEKSETPQQYTVSDFVYVIVFLNGVFANENEDYGIVNQNTIVFNQVLPIGTDVVIVYFINNGVEFSPTYQVDSSISADSTNAVQNRTINSKFESVQSDYTDKINNTRTELMSDYTSKIGSLKTELTNDYTDKLTKLNENLSSEISTTNNNLTATNTKFDGKFTDIETEITNLCTKYDQELGVA